MRNGTPLLSSFERALDLLDAILDDGDESSLSDIARRRGVPMATAHRHVATLVEAGMLSMVARGCHVAGPRLFDFARRIDPALAMVKVAARVLSPVARRMGCVVQLGTLDGDMVTYRVKTGGDLFTQVGMQLEAYCSAIGKVLLASLSATERRRYLDGGPFVALTANTITAPEALVREFETVRNQGFACDNEEICEGLCCIAVPVHDGEGRVVAAISASFPGSPGGLERHLPALEAVCALIREQCGYTRLQPEAISAPSSFISPDHRATIAGTRT